MAEVPINRLMPSGYDDDFVAQPDKDLHCIICHLPLKEPVLTRCGHRFCRECLEEYFRRQDQDGCILTCPVDREALERNKDIFPDKLAERKILSLLIKCPSEGCEWNGELRAKEDHLASCNFKAVSCTNENCEVKVPKKELNEHVTTCQWRIAECVYCREHYPQCQMENHLKACLTACPNKCGTRIAIEMISSHVENCCPLTVVPCPYIGIGCNSEMRRQELESHLQSETKHHLELRCCKLNSLEEKLTYSQKQHQTKLEEKVKALEENPQERVNVLENQLEMRAGLAPLSHYVVGFVIFSVLLGVVIQGIQSHIEKKVADVQKIMLLNPAEPYTFTWKIISFENALMHAKNGRQTKIESEPFYMYGYKLKLRLWPNGCATGYKTHLSLILIIMKGEYDAILDWPFQKKLKFTLIDQQENSADRENVIFEYTPDSKDGVFAKPTKIETFALKYYTFTSHERLRTRRFVVDDVILIQIQVGPLS